MAFIYNIKTKVLTECLNEDVIKVCRQDPLHYIVDKSLAKINNQLLDVDIKEKIDEDDSDSKRTPLSKMKLDDLKRLANELNLESDGLNCDELRKIIKDAQGK